ncbi:alpha/beta fold hydrolase [Arthrobacter sp. UM1]|uniref:alpha/beta fold hydrolase n=1 Tax=Arthrobacter sp. UM1 TaxID=2766776 RepID=UPI001CF70798|nr:alpha/beta hydrolase [Arthrobacter sp. UM1]MCB4207261.1 alpha/beta hydrolase [Arthrobacter sp. UM1]
MSDLREMVLDRPGCVVHYRRREAQHGRWVVFLHGAGMDGHMFDAQLAALPSDVGAVCWDARGHGQSKLNDEFRYPDMCEDLHALISTLGPNAVTLVGQSMGGNLAQSYLDRHPDRVARLVLIDCTDNHGPLTLREKLALRCTKAVLSVCPWNALVRQSARVCGRSAATVDYAESCLRQVGKRRFIEIMGFWADCLAPDPAYRLSVPTLALVGEQDRSGNIRKAMQRLTDRNAETILVTLLNAAHNSNMDDPAAANEALIDFLQQ